MMSNSQDRGSDVDSCCAFVRVGLKSRSRVLAVQKWNNTMIQVSSLYLTRNG
jgi:hypothetical protein